MSIKEIIANAISGNAGEFEAAFDSVMASKMETAISAKYQSMFKEEKDEDMEDDEEDGEDDEDELDESKKSVFVDRMEWKGSKWVSSPSKNVPSPLEDIFGKVNSSGKVNQVMLIRQTNSSPITGFVLQTGLSPEKVRNMLNDYNPVVNSSEVFKIVPSKMWVYVDTPMERIKKEETEK